MTREEISEAISYIKCYRQLDENLHNAAPKGSVGFYATEKCLHYWDMAIEALEQEPKYCDRNICIRNEHNGIGCGECEVTKSQELCEDAVSREFMYKLGAKCIAARNENGVLVAITSIESLPPVTPQPKTGYWIKHDTGHSICYACSRCSCVAPYTETADKWLWKLSNYCPDCGAKMIEQKEDTK